MCTFQRKLTKPNASAGKRGWQVVKYLWYWGPCYCGLTNMGFWRLLYVRLILISVTILLPKYNQTSVFPFTDLFSSGCRSLWNSICTITPHTPQLVLRRCSVRSRVQLCCRSASYLQPTNLPFSTGCCYSPTVISSCSQLERVVTEDREYGWLI